MGEQTFSDIEWGISDNVGMRLTNIQEITNTAVASVYNVRTCDRLAGLFENLCHRPVTATRFENWSVKLDVPQQSARAPIWRLIEIRASRLNQSALRNHHDPGVY